MAIRFVPNGEGDPFPPDSESARIAKQLKEERKTLVALGGMGAMPKEIVDRAVGANPPISIYTALRPGARSAADVQINWEDFRTLMRSKGVDLANTNPADVEYLRAKYVEGLRQSPPGGVR